jgi:protein phosphatase 1L
MPLRAHLPPPIRGCLGALAKVWLSFFLPQMASGVQSIAFGHYLIKGKSRHAMEDYYVTELKKVNDHELGLFAIYDGHLGHHVAHYLEQNLFNNILNETGFWKDPKLAIQKAYLSTDGIILENALKLGPGGSTAVTAILIDSKTLFVANVGDSRAVISQAGDARQLSVDHEPGTRTEREKIEEKGGFVSNMPGDVPRVDGQLAVARAFGDKSLKVHLSAQPDIKQLEIDEETEFLILASDGLWKVMDNQEAVDLVKKIKDPTAAAKQLATEAVNRKSKDDISCIVVRFI